MSQGAVNWFTDAVGGVMQRVNEFSFYELASKIHPLTDIQGDQLLSSVWLDWWNARLAVDAIFSERPLSVCAAAALELQQAITSVVPEKFEDLNLALSSPDQKTLPPWKLYPVSEAAKKFETVLAAECQVLDTYFVSKKGAYSTADLVEHAHTQVPKPIRDKLSEQVKEDLDQAGKCIAFDLATAAAFHLLRGTEGVLREYYNCVVPGIKRALPKMRNWGAYIKLLKEHGAEQRVTSLLDHLRESYRNPVLHPEESYTDARALVLFGVCVSALVMMLEEIERLTPRGLPLPLMAIPTTGEVLTLPETK